MAISSEIACQLDYLDRVKAFLTPCTPDQINMIRSRDQYGHDFFDKSGLKTHVVLNVLARLREEIITNSNEILFGQFCQIKTGLEDYLEKRIVILKGEQPVSDHWIKGRKITSDISTELREICFYLQDVLLSSQTVIQLRSKTFCFDEAKELHQFRKVLKEYVNDLSNPEAQEIKSLRKHFKTLEHAFKEKKINKAKKALKRIDTFLKTPAPSTANHQVYSVQDS